MSFKFIRNDLMTLTEAADYLGITPQYMGRLVKRYTDVFSHTLRAGRIWLLDKEQVEEFKKYHYLRRY